MAKTYNSIPTVATGDVYTATAHNNIVTNVNNYRVPPMCKVRMTSNDTPYTSQTLLSWDAEEYDTDDMYTSGTNVTINTAGVYVMTFTGSASIGTSWSLMQPRILQNATPIAIVFAPFYSTSTSWSLTMTSNLAATDVLTCDLNCAGTGTITVNGAAAPTASSCALHVTWLGQVS